MKQCSKCLQFKPLSEFYRDASKKDGFRFLCKLCLREKDHERQKRWNQEHPEKKKEYNQKYKKRIESQYGISVATIRRYGLKTALEVYDKYHRKCAYCSEENDLTIHHLDNKGRNYEDKGLKPNNDIDNLIVLCRRCHGRIHGKQGGRLKKL